MEQRHLFLINEKEGAKSLELIDTSKKEPGKSMLIETIRKEGKHLSCRKKLRCCIYLDQKKVVETSMVTSTTTNEMRDQCALIPETVNMACSVFFSDTLLCKYIQLRIVN